MTSKLVRVELAESFISQLDQIEIFLSEVEAPAVYDDLLIQLRSTVIPNLRQFPRMGRLFLERTPQSAEALAQLAKLPIDMLNALREYLMGDYLILYTYVNNTVVLLTIRHHRQLSFNFKSLWSND